MEVVLLWLDDLEDLVLMVPAVCERLRWRCLQTGLIAALTLAGMERTHTLSHWAPPVAAIAVLAVLAWLLGISTVRLVERMGIREPNQGDAQALAAGGPFRSG